MGRAAPRFSPTDAAQNYRPATFGGSEVCGKRILEGDGPREGRPQPCATRQARREGSGFAARSRSHAAAGRAVHRGAAVGRPRRSGREATLTDRWLPDRPLPTAHALAQNLGVIIRFMSTDYGGAGGVLSLPVGCSPGWASIPCSPVAHARRATQQNHPRFHKTRQRQDLDSQTNKTPLDCSEHGRCAWKEPGPPPAEWRRRARRALGSGDRGPTSVTPGPRPPTRRCAMRSLRGASGAGRGVRGAGAEGQGSRGPCRVGGAAPRSESPNPAATWAATAAPDVFIWRCRGDTERGVRPRGRELASATDPNGDGNVTGRRPGSD